MIGTKHEVLREVYRETSMNLAFLWLIYSHFSLAAERIKIAGEMFVKSWHDLRAYYLNTSQKCEIIAITGATL